MGATKPILDSRIVMYSTFRKEIDKEFYNLTLKKSLIWGFITSIVAGGVINMIGDMFSNGILYSLGICSVFLTTISAYRIMSFSDEKEDEMISLILLRLRRDIPHLEALKSLEDRCVESNKNSSGRLQSAIVLVPSFAGFIGAVVASMIAIKAPISYDFTAFLFIVVSVLLNNLASELKKIRFDSALAVAIKLYKQESDWQEITKQYIST